MPPDQPCLTAAYFIQAVQAWPIAAAGFSTARMRSSACEQGCFTQPCVVSEMQSPTLNPESLPDPVPGLVAGTLDVAAADMVLVPVAEPPEPEEAHPAT